MNKWLVLLIFRLIFTKRETAHGPQTLRGPEGCKFNVHQTVCDKSIWGSGLGWCISKNRERKKKTSILVFVLVLADLVSLSPSALYLPEV